MRKFSIKDLERFSHFKAHSIRMWERRYRILTPQRNIANIRHYTLQDVERMLDMSILLAHGYKISRVAGMSREEITSRLSSMISGESAVRMVINRLIVQMYAAEIEAFEDLLDNSIQRWGIDKVIKEVVIPFLEKVQILSYKDTSVEAHFVVTAVRKKLIAGIEATQQRFKAFKTILLFLPDGEHYDLMLLYMTYIIKGFGFNVLYLGTNISRANLEYVLHTKKADYLFAYLTSTRNFDLDGYLGMLKETFPKLPFFIATGSDKDLLLAEQLNTQTFAYKDLETVLQQLY